MTHKTCHHGSRWQAMPQYAGAEEQPCQHRPKSQRFHCSPLPHTVGSLTPLACTAAEATADMAVCSCLQQPTDDCNGTPSIKHHPQEPPNTAAAARPLFHATYCCRHGLLLQQQLRLFDDAPHTWHLLLLLACTATQCCSHIGWSCLLLMLHLGAPP